MSLIEWDSSFSVGSDVLDADHHRLVDALNRIYDAWQSHHGADELNRLFDELLDYVDGHFLREEEMLARCNYPRLDVQQSDHQVLREQVVAFRARHLDGGEPDALSADMARFLKNWLLDHVLGEDMLYKDAVSRP